jgi:carbonic anhydrase
MTSSNDLIRAARSASEDVPARPRRGLAVVTCMDARVDPWRLLGAGPGDLHVIRNAGGVVTGDVLRSLTVSQRRLDTTAIDVIMHTECGMLGLDERALATEILRADPAAEVPRFHAFGSLERELARGIEVLRASPLLPARGRIRGQVYDVASQRLRTVIGL